jgi:nucleoside-diphosphate-sugar epimerase
MILVTGAGGLIGRHVVAALGPERARGVSHQAVTAPDLLLGVTTVVHAGRDPLLGKPGWRLDADAEIRLAERLRGTGIRLVSLGSRKVLAPSDRPLREDAVIGPVDAYGRAKALLEAALVERLGDRVTRLRIANVIGIEPPGRASFMGAMLAGLVADRTIRFDMAAETRRDFVPVAFVARAIARLAHDPPGGIVHLGSGHAIPCGLIARWTIEGFGRGRLVVERDERRDAFVLDTGRLRALTGLTCPRATIRDAAVAAGRAAAVTPG